MVERDGGIGCGIGKKRIEKKRKEEAGWLRGGYDRGLGRAGGVGVVLDGGSAGVLGRRN